MRKDAALSALTENQQAELYEWLCNDTFESVRARLAKQPPKGFGIKTHVTSLTRFFRARQIEIQAADFAEIASDPSTQNEVIKATNEASNRAFAHSTYVLAHLPLSTENYRALSRVMQRNEFLALKREFLDVARENLALARERLKFDQRQFEYNAARAALSSLPDLMAIEGIKHIDDEEKIWRVRERLFGASAQNELQKSKGNANQ